MKTDPLGQFSVSGNAGGFLIAQHLAHMMLIQTLRAHLAQRMTERVGWFYALADKNIGAAITAMHDAPAHRWTLQALAKCAGLSRSSFALKFKAKVGASPMDYLSQWRMLLAAEKLAHTKDSISAIALTVGYESDSAFSTAFKRIMKCEPPSLRRSHGRVSPASGRLFDRACLGRISALFFEVSGCAACGAFAYFRSASEWLAITERYSLADL